MSVVQRDLERRGGVGQARTVDVQQQPTAVGEMGERRQLIGAVARPELGALADADDARLHGMLVTDPGDLRRGELRRELAVECRDGVQLRTGDPLWRTALVDVDVGLRGADDRLPGPAQRADRQHVGGAAVEHEVGLGLFAEVLAQERLGPRRPGVRPVRGGVALVGLGDRGEHLRVGAGVVVRCEALHAVSVEAADGARRPAPQQPHVDRLTP